MQPVRLYESLFILYKCNRSINQLRPVVNRHQNATGDIKEIAVLLVNNIKLEAVSFLDEFNAAFINNVEVEYKERVMDLRKITAPITKRIKKWKDLEKYRNNIIAHPWRDNGKLAIPDPHFYNIPHTWFEVAMLVHRMNYLWELINAEFKTEVPQALLYVYKLKPADEESTTRVEDVNADHLKMAEEVDAICKSLNKPYFLKVLQYKPKSGSEEQDLGDDLMLS